MNASDVPSELHCVFQIQRAAYEAAPFAEWDERRGRLERLQRLLHNNESAIESAIDSDFAGRPHIETQIAEIFPSGAEIRGALKHGKRWMKPRSASVSKWFLPARAQVVPRPLGVVGIIVPWNYPLFLAVSPLVTALAAGNRVMIKMSEFTPTFSELFQRLVASAFRANEVAVITGGPEVAAQFSALPFDHLLFTGSTTVGRKVMGAAAQNLTPLTLELGGKSPTVIAPGYPIEHAAQRVLAGKLLNAGQTCIAPDYVLVPRAMLRAFVESARRQARAMYPAGLADKDYCSIVNARQYDRLRASLQQVRAAGTEIVPLFDGTESNDAAHRLAPAILVDPPAQTSVMCDEIFGPLLPVVAYDDLKEALAFINAQPRPLALYWFDNDRQRVEWALKNTHAGGVCINETLMHVAQDDLPFGGVGASGMGHYHGRWGFDTFSKLTPVFRQSRFNGMKLFLPPYKPHVARMLRLMKKF
ncbi:MAG: coniferyl aldehyde dehydrogenase [Burkholderiaceae bacterium]|nr:coniferyl aldehyde dehydrogenase [Burkholderiaceae bacterium]